MEKSFETIEYSTENGVATILLNRPKSYNAFTATMNKEIISALRQADRDDEVGSIVITGAGKAFCAGQDLGSVDEDTNYADILRDNYHPMIRAMRSTSKPIISAINGAVAGAGMSLALMSDFRVMKEGTKFVSAFMNIGLIPDAGFMQILPRIIGYARALEVAVLGKPIPAEEAVELGLATEVYEEAEWEEKVKAFAEQLASLPTVAFKQAKRYMLDSMNESLETFLEKEAQAQRIAGLTQDHREGMKAFAEKRKPKFIGK